MQWTQVCDPYRFNRAKRMAWIEKNESEEEERTENYTRKERRKVFKNQTRGNKINRYRERDYEKQEVSPTTSHRKWKEREYCNR